MSRVLVEMKAVGKSFPRIHHTTQRLSALWHALRADLDPDTIAVLADINLCIKSGESLALIGENGAGKSTLLKILAGVLRPTTGSVAVHCKVGALLELGAGFHPEFTGRENIRLAASLMGMSPDQVRSATPAIIEFADIGRYIDQPINHYSSGMAVRLGFAVISVFKPDLLITDEVLAVGDESFQRKCTDWIENYLAEGGTLLLVSHSMAEVRRLCSRALWIHQGRIQASGEADEVVDLYLHYAEEQFRKYNELDPDYSGGGYRITDLRINDQDQQDIVVLNRPQLQVSVTLHSSDDRPPVIALGIKDAHGIAVYGTTSEIDGAVPTRISVNRYRFDVCFELDDLKPGRYTVSGHAMEPEGLRLYDTVTRKFELPGDANGKGYLKLDITER